MNYSFNYTIVGQKSISNTKSITMKIEVFSGTRS